MDHQSSRKRAAQIAIFIGLVAALFFAHKLVERQLVLVQATVTNETSLRTTAEAQAHAAQETAVAAQNLQATGEAQVKELTATATAQSPLPPPITTGPQPFEPDQETLAYQLALEAELILNEQPALLERSVLLAVEAVQRYPQAGIVDVLKSGIALLPNHNRILNHQDFSYILAYSPDGQYIASAGNDNNAVLIWDVNNDREAARLVYENQIKNITFSPEGHYLAILWGDISGGENTVTLWEVSTGEEKFSFLFDHTFITSQFSPDTYHLAIATEDTVTLWDLTTGQEVMRLPNNGTDVAFSSDGQFLYTIHNGVQQWDIATGTQEDPIIGEDNIKGRTVFSPQGRYLFSDDFIWSLETGTAVQLNAFNFYPEIEFSPDESFLVIAQGEASLSSNTFGQDLVQLWDVATGRELMRIEEFAFDIAFSPDSRYLVVPMGRVARVWELPGQQEAFRIVAGETISSPVFSPNGQTVIVHNSNWVTERRSTEVWEMIPVQWYRRFEHGSPSGIHSLAFSPDGQYVVTSGEENFVYVWDTATGKEVTRFDHQQYGASVVTFSPDSRYLLSGGASIPYGAEYTNVTHLWDMITMSEAISLTHGYRVADASFSPDGLYFATAGFPDTITVFEAETGTDIFSVADKGYQNLNFSPDGHYMVAMDLDTIWLWDTTNWQEVREINNIFPGNFGFGSDDQWIVFEGRDAERNSTLYVQEIETGREVLTLPYEDGVRSVDISPDNKYLAVSSGSFWEYNSALHIWNIESGEQLINLPTDNVLGAGIFSYDSRYLAFENTEGVVSVLDMTTLEEIARLMHPKGIFNIVFSPDDQQILIQSGISFAYLWRYLPSDIVAEACNRLSRNLTLEEWQTFIGDEPYRPTCPDLSIE